MIDVHPGQELAELTEVQLHEGDSDDMVSLEELNKQRLSSSQMAKAGMDGGILGGNDWSKKMCKSTHCAQTSTQRP
jgi:hypothetical protein